jgi:hypothetical protein
LANPQLILFRANCKPFSKVDNFDLVAGPAAKSAALSDSVLYHAWQVLNPEGIVLNYTTISYILSDILYSIVVLHV